MFYVVDKALMIYVNNIASHFKQIYVSD